MVDGNGDSNAKLEEITETKFDEYVASTLEEIMYQMAELQTHYTNVIRTYQRKQSAVNSGEYNVRYYINKNGEIQFIKEEKRMGFK